MAKAAINTKLDQFFLSVTQNEQHCSVRDITRPNNLSCVSIIVIKYFLFIIWTFFFDTQRQKALLYKSSKAYNLHALEIL